MQPKSYVVGVLISPLVALPQLLGGKIALGNISHVSDIIVLSMIMIGVFNVSATQHIVNEAEDPSIPNTAEENMAIMIAFGVLFGMIVAHAHRLRAQDAKKTGINWPIYYVCMIVSYAAIFLLMNAANHYFVNIY